MMAWALSRRTFHKLRSMDGTQAIYAEKIIADVLYQGQMKMLSTLSIHQFLGVDNATVYLESHSKWWPGPFQDVLLEFM